MKLKTNWIIFLFLCAPLLFIAGCSKDKAVERHLTKDGGKWNIDAVTWSKIEQTSGGQTTNSGTGSNVGSFTFEKGGSGSFSYIINSTTREGKFDWSVSDEQVTLTYINQSVDFTSGAITQIAIAYSGKQPSKTSLTLDGSETYQYSSGSITQSVFTGSFNLTK